MKITYLPRVLAMIGVAVQVKSVMAKMIRLAFRSLWGEPTLTVKLFPTEFEEGLIVLARVFTIAVVMR